MGFINLSNASSQTIFTVQASGIIAIEPAFDGPSYLIQAIGLNKYRAINETDGSIIYSSTSASDLINSVIKSNSLITFGTGTFLLTNSITKQANNVAFEGQGDRTLLQTETSMKINAFTLTNVYGWTIRNLTIEGTYNGVYAENGRNLNIVNNHIIDTYHDGIALFSSINCTVASNTIGNATRGFGVHVWNTTDSQVLKNVVDFTYWSCIAVSDGSNYNLVDKNVVSRGGQMGTLGDGIEIGSTPRSGGTVGNVVINNTCHDNVIDGISVAQSNTTGVYGNSVFNNFVHGISVESNCTGTLLTGNTVYNNSVNTDVGSGGIIVMGLDTSDTMIQSNMIFNNWKDGILLYQSSNNSVIGNRVFDNGQKSDNKYAGISIATSNDRIENNLFYDDQSLKTQIYDMLEEPGYSNNTIIRNTIP